MAERMAKRKAYVLESRRKRTAERWGIEQVDAGLGARRRIYGLLRHYREMNNRHAFRVVVYKPTESKPR